MGPERKYINKVHRQLDKISKQIHRQCMTGTGSGTPDYYYEGPIGCLWVEYKATPQNISYPDLLKYLTALQQAWLYRAVYNGVRCGVLAGRPDGTGLFYQGISWQKSTSGVKVTKIEAAQLIAQMTLGVSDDPE